MNRTVSAPRALPFLALVAAPLLMASCGGNSGSGNGGSAGGGPKTLTAATSDDIQYVDPAHAFDTWSTAVVQAFTRRLVGYDPQGKLVPDLAEKWDTSADGKTYTFHLAPGIAFSDGTPIQAKHFKAEYQRLVDPKEASQGAGFYRGIAGMDTPDDATLVVRLKQPDPTLLNVMGMTFMAPIKEGQDPSHPASSGPYVLETYQPGQRVVLKRNPQDKKNPSSLAGITLQLKVAQPLQLTRFRSGEIDLLPEIPPAEYQRVMRDPSEKDNVVQGTVNQTWYFGMNTTRPPWNDPRIRRAAFLALNRQRQVEIAGPGQLANGFLPPQVPGYDPARKLPEQNLAEAKRLLAEAGYPSGIPTKTTLWLSATSQFQRHAEAIQSDLAAAGILVDLKPLTFSQYLSGYRTKADCWYGGWYPDYPDAGNFLEPVLHSRSIPPNGSNAAHYANSKVDALLDRAHATPLGPRREALYKQAEDLLAQDLPWAPLYFEVETRWFRDGVTGVTVHPVWRQTLVGIDKK